MGLYHNCFSWGKVRIWYNAQYMQDCLSYYKGKKVLVTGHTGFKGSWLCEWLLALGAEVHGFALPPPTKPALFAQLKLAKRIKSHTIGDIRDLAAVKRCVKRVRPEIVFHLAAQPLVRLSYRQPVETFDTNVMGTVNVLEAVRAVFSSKSGSKAAPLCKVVCITTDKVYENDNRGRAFVEDDPKGGSDPYSASKGACELAIQSYRRSFFADGKGAAWVASARAGNVIGGGDWALDRIVPDAMRAFISGKTLTVRNDKSTRPWQHVLEPLYGYLTLGAQRDFVRFSTAYNFGPSAATVKTVGELVKETMSYFDRPKFENRTDPNAVPEAKLLTLDSRKAKRLLGWTPHWKFKETIRNTVEWYQAVAVGADPMAVTDRQIEEYVS